jgi:DNA-binding transcriptional LysR family regulator
MDWNGVRMFLALARTGRLSTAARQLGVEHTTVSRRLAGLEENLGTPLFYRTVGGYRLTPAGESTLPAAEAMERAARQLGASARERTGIVEGQVRLALVPEFASHWLAPQLPLFRRLHPRIELQVLVGTRQLDLSRGEAELAVRLRPRQTGLVAMRLARTSLGLYASKAVAARYRIDPADPDTVDGVPLLVYTAQYRQLQDAAWLEPMLARAAIVLRTNSTELLLAAARAAAGVAVLPRFVARRFHDLAPVSPDVAATDVWLITHPEFRRDPKVRATADFLKRIAAGANGLAD